MSLKETIDRLPHELRAWAIHQANAEGCSLEELLEMKLGLKLQQEKDDLAVAHMVTQL